MLLCLLFVKLTKNYSEGNIFPVLNFLHSEYFYSKEKNVNKAKTCLTIFFLTRVGKKELISRLFSITFRRNGMIFFV